MTRVAARLVAVLALLGGLAACVPDPNLVQSGASAPQPMADASTYAATKDANIDIPGLPIEEIPEPFRRQVVAYETDQAPGTIIINPAQKVLYFVTGKNRAIRYGIAVGRAGFEWSGEAIVNEKKPWPTWTPPKEMIERDPKLAKWEKGQPGGPTNPLGARAIYLTTNGVDYGYRIHGTPDWRSIGRNASSGCIRMINQDVMDLFNRVPMGAKVIVLTASGEMPTGLKLPPPAPKKKVEPVVPAGAIPKLVVLPPPVMSAPVVAPAAATAPVVAPELVTLPAPAAAPAAPAAAAPAATDAASCKVALVNGVCPPAQP
jgi:lipoprotein-anchoring transpeptidase ErfK/SrfK